jgi:hypothetical protein
MRDWVKAGTIDTRFEGDRISQALNEAEIPFFIKSFHDTAYDGLYLLQKGWAAVLVPEEFKEQAQGIVADVKQGFQEEGEDEIDRSG